ncbi:MAG: Eco57I restriction-modification methylase domain-containing protein, partial [Polyangiaceae bacterium]
MQWNRQAATLWSEQHFTIVADEEGPRTEQEKFVFPSVLLKDTRRFDELVNGLADKAAAPERKKKSPPPSVERLLDRLSIPAEMRPGIRETFATMCSLHDQDRDHIWGYYIRNQARPEWLARPESQVDVLIGNPPWLAYSHMPKSMQGEFKTLSEQYHLWMGAKQAPHQDLSALFVVRAADKYLKTNGRFAFVMPNAVLDRGQYRGFQAATFDYPQVELRLRFAKPWDLKRIRPHFFPRGAAVVFGAKAQAALAIPSDVEVWSGRLPREDATWIEVKDVLTRAGGVVEPEPEFRSEYHRAFHQGATIVPRVLFMVEKQKAGPLGQVAGQTAVRSERSANEKKPWKMLPSMDGVV